MSPEGASASTTGRRVIGSSRSVPGESRVASGPPTPPREPNLWSGRSSGRRFGDRNMTRGSGSLRRRPRLRHVLIGVLLLVVLIPVLTLGLLWRDYSRIDRVDLSKVLSTDGSRGGTNTLIVGTDSRSGITESDPNASAFIAGSVSGSRTDTIMVLHTAGSVATIVSIPRDLWVTDPATGGKSRINATYASGPENLVQAISDLGIPIDQYMEMDFSGFGDMVDAVGGVSVEVPAATRDTHSGLQLDAPGRHLLDGTQALAYVRSRYYEELIGGRWRMDGTADIGRTERQRTLVMTLLRSVVGSRSPIALVGIGSAIGDGMVLDSEMGMFDLLSLARNLNGSEMVTETLPVSGRVTSGGADVLDLQPSASSIIDRLAT
jgi:LCP family protein required for cell wall assembly